MCTCYGRTFSDLLKLNTLVRGQQYCDKQIVQANYIYSIAGRIGVRMRDRGAAALAEIGPPVNPLNMLGRYNLSINLRKRNRHH